ncbi:MAG: hypothetical protein IKN38_03945 [Clostridia bacterium]|nr:hypothetical protein [Clostridia bacterium]
MDKLKVLFPYVEAGFGHIMPMKSIEETFRKKYGERVDVIRSSFFTEGGDRHMIKYEKLLGDQVRTYNRHPFIGYLACYSCEFFGVHLSSLGSIRITAPIGCSRGIRHMEELSPDVVVSTHWATNYYAEHLPEDKKPMTIMYCPDAVMYKLFKYRCDLTMISMPRGYEIALQDKKRYNEDNMKYVPFPIRNEAFAVPRDKRELRRSLGLPEDKFTVIFVEGGYGIGKIWEVCSLLAKERLPLTLIPVCGTNGELYRRFETLECSEEVTVAPYMFTDRILELEASSDLFCGKSGNILAEATFFGVPSLVTHFASLTEQHIAEHYMNTVGCTMKEFSPERAAKLVADFVKDPALLEPYRRAAQSYHENFGSEAAADAIWDAITKKFPSLRLQ